MKDEVVFAKGKYEHRSRRGIVVVHVPRDMRLSEVSAPLARLLQK